MDHCHTSFKGRRLRLKWAECKIHSEKASSMWVWTAPMAPCTRAIYLNMLQFPKYQIALEYVHDHPHVPRECGRVGLTRAISHRHFQQQGIFFHRDLPSLFPNVCQCIGQPLQRESWGLIQRCVFPLIIWGIHLSRIFASIGIHHRHTTANNDNIIYKPLGYSLYTLRITLCGIEWSLNKVKTNAVCSN